MKNNTAQFSPSDISAVVCSYQAIASIEACLNSLRAEGVGEIIVVDANSTDGTAEVANRLADSVVNDPKKGLALARNMGINKASKEYILNFGADNIAAKGSFQKMINYSIQHNLTGTSAPTLLENKNMNYFSSAMNIYKQCRFFPGIRSVIGTPTLFKRDLILKEPFDVEMKFCDDSDLCDRLSEKGCRFGIADTIVYEAGCETLLSIYKRWVMYGWGDRDYYKKHSKQWGMGRKLISVLHPLHVELVQPLIRLSIFKKIYLLPFLLLITVLRYVGWIKHL
jgi:glycosyltransferase involved in cell wall biosynthesis